MTRPSNPRKAMPGERERPTSDKVRLAAGTRHEASATVRIGRSGILVALLTLGAMGYATPTQANVAGCPNTDDEFRTGNAQCVFSCGGSDTISVSASADQTLEKISGKAECGGAVAECVKLSSSSCGGDSNDLTTRAQNEGACKATGFDPWWAGRYELTADCTSEWDPDADPLCITFKKDCLCLDFNDCPIAVINLKATIIDGIVVHSAGTDLVTGQSFVPVVSTQKTTDGLTITIST